jgi:hypothetical protein
MNRREFAMCCLGAGIQEAISRRLYGQAFTQPAEQGVEPYSLLDTELLLAVKGRSWGILND